jgi:hypothetical protein
MKPSKEGLKLNKMLKDLMFSLPRPSAINDSIMRQADVQLSEYQRAEEMIKVRLTHSNLFELNISGGDALYAPF